jgi:hypothetical protein
MSDERTTTRFTQADLDRLDQKMRTPPPPAMHLRPSPGGMIRRGGDGLARDYQNDFRATISRGLNHLPADRAYQPGSDPRFTRRDLDRDR